MVESWDTIVAGAGIGGLSAATRLANAGLQVLVLERNAHVGGTAYTFFRNGFWLPMGPLGISSPEFVRKNLAELGVDAGIEFNRVHYRVLALGLSVLISTGFEETAENLKNRFPGDRDGIDFFFSEVERLSRARDDPEERPSLSAAAQTSSAEFLAGLIRDRRLRCLLGSQGAQEPYMAMPLLAAMWRLLGKQGIWYPGRGFRNFCDRLSRAVTGSGRGEIRLGAEIEEIRVKQGAVAGVTLAGGEQIQARAVISNADYKRTFLSLIKKDVLPGEFLSAVKSARQTASIFQVGLGVDPDRVDLAAFEGASRLIYQREGASSDRPFDPARPALEPEELARQQLELSLLSADDPALAPAGKSVLVIRTEVDYNHFTRFRTGHNQRAPGYREYKLRLARALIREAERILHGLTDAVLLMDVATPLTFRDRGGRSEGAVAGWSWDFEDNREGEARELSLTPIKGLYMAGYQALSSLFTGGVPTALESGDLAARLVLEEAGPTSKILIPGVR